MLNALLGDKFSEVALRRTTAGINFFRTIQPKKQNGVESNEEDSNPDDGWSTIVDDRKIQGADSVHEEIKKDNKELSDDSLNVDESLEVDNRMSGDKVLRILRDYIIKENKHIKDALEITGITSDHMVSRQNLKEAIKKITGALASYDEINKALDHFHSVSLEKKQDK